MAYTDFTLDNVEERLGVRIRPGALFPVRESAPVPGWLETVLALTRRGTALSSEKARSEGLVYPILMAAHEGTAEAVTLFSGQSLDVEASRGLTGVCDYILARTENVPRLKAPLLTVVEAKKADLDSGLAQCVAQTVAAALFNERAGAPTVAVYGCVSSGLEWKFLRLAAGTVVIDVEPFFLSDVGRLLAALRSVLGAPAAASVS